MSKQMRVRTAAGSVGIEDDVTSTKRDAGVLTKGMVVPA
jgi:hypothetical protein